MSNDSLSDLYSFCVAPYQTLIEADLLFNLPCNEQVSLQMSQGDLLIDLACKIALPTSQYKNTPAGKPTSWLPFVGWLSPKLAPGSSLHAQFLWMAGGVQGAPNLPNGGSTQQRRAQFAKDAEAVAAWDFERIIPCHGDVIETNGKKAFLDAFSKVGATFCIGAFLIC